MYWGKEAKRNIKALVIMTTDDEGKLIPAENSVRYHYHLSGPPYWGKQYNAVYIENKVHLRYDAYEPEKRIEVDSKKDGHLAEYFSNITEYTLFGKNAGKSREINKNGIALYHCVIPKGAFYEETESGEIRASQITIGKKYTFPKRFMHLQVGDEVWCAVYSDYDRHNRHFEFLGKTKIKEIVEHHRDKNSSYGSYINVKVEGHGTTFYLNPYHTIDFDDAMHVHGAKVISLSKEDLITSFTDRFGKWIKNKMEIIEEEQQDIKLTENLLESVKNCK